MVRRIQVAVPSDLSEEIVDHLSREIGDYLGTLTKKPVTAETIVYTDLEDVITRLQAIEPGVVLFIFKDDNPADYFNISYRLNKWRVHRITTDVLKSKFEKSLAELSLSARNEKDLTKVSRPWRSFVQLNALDLLQRLDCIPWIISDNLRYQMYVAIDVSKDGRYVGYSLFSNNARNKKTPFYLQTEVDVKADPKSETINHLHLKDKLISLFGTLRDLEEIVPITSLLFVRDGRFRGKEMEGISLAVNDLILQNIVSKDALIHFVNVHKQSVKGIRMWERTVDGKVGHLLEGTLMILDDKTAVLTNTGQATLHQGTADPILLIAQCGGMDIKTVAEDIHSTSQLNYSSPSVAQRLPIFLKRTDEELQGRESQEIRRLK
jgi:hypothetical protein